jgi:ABC-type nitrate/sulfonate/bicarbonate transport system substrate-binding protein
MGVRKDLDIVRGDIKALMGLRISSSFAFPRTALRHMLVQAGMDMDHDEVRVVESLPTNSEWHSATIISALTTTDALIEKQPEVAAAAVRAVVAAQKAPTLKRTRHSPRKWVMRCFRVRKPVLCPHLLHVMRRSMTRPSHPKPSTA